MARNAKTLAADLHNVNKIAKSITQGYMPEVYALNHNYSTFQIEKGSRIDTSYTLYDRHTVERLFRKTQNYYQTLLLTQKQENCLQKTRI